MSLFKQRGFSAVEVVIAIVVVAAIGATGFLAYNRIQDRNANNTSQQTDDGSKTNAPAVNNTEDLDEATQVLDDANLDASTSDSAELDSETSSF